MILLCGVMAAVAQTLQITTRDHMVYLANPDEAGEMVFANGSLSIGQEVFEVSNIASMDYLIGNFDPQYVSVEYSGSVCLVRMPLALASQLNVERDGQYVTITNSATDEPEITYALSGATNDGSLTLVGDYKCGVILNGVNIKSNKGPALYIKNGKRIDIETKGNTINRFEDAAGGEHDACFLVKGHPEFKGNGSIYITGNSGHGYKSGEYTLFKRTTGLFQISSAANDAMHIGQYFEMRGGNVVIQNGVKGDGIQIEKNSDPAKENNGMIKLDSGIVNINLASDDVSGIKCDSTFTCNGGQITVLVSGNFAKGINVPYNAIITESVCKTNITATSTGGYMTISGDKKKSTAFKVDGNFYFHAGTIKATANEDKKGRSLKIGGDYYYVPGKINITTDPDMDISGAMRVMSE